MAVSLRAVPRRCIKIGLGACFAFVMLAIYAGVGPAITYRHHLDQQTDYPPHLYTHCLVPDPLKIHITQPRPDLKSSWEKVGATFVSGITGYRATREGQNTRESNDTPFHPHPPRVLDPTLFSSHCEFFQDYFNCPEGQWQFPDWPPEEDPFVAVIDKYAWIGDGYLAVKDHIFVSSQIRSSEEMTVYNASFANFTQVFCYPKLISIVALYYTEVYHWIIETLPRVLLAKQIIDRDPETMILVQDWMKPFVKEYLELLGIPRSRVVSLWRPPGLVALQAKQMFIPKYSRIFGVQREALFSVKEAVLESVERAMGGHIPKPKTQPIVYVARTGRSRKASNEIEFLSELARFVKAYNQRLNDDDGDVEEDEDDNKPLPLEILLYYGNVSVLETVRLFQHARVILGTHGAGMANKLWSPSSVSIIDFEFVQGTYGSYSLYWELSALLGLDHWLVPIPGMLWSSEFYSIPISEVMDIIHYILPLPALPSFPPSTTTTTTTNHLRSCPPGSVFDDSRKLCSPCPAGTYHSIAFEKCVPCIPGRYNPDRGRTFCASCPTFTFSAHEGATGCEYCPLNKHGIAYTDCMSEEEKKIAQKEKKVKEMEEKKKERKERRKKEKEAAEQAAKEN